MTDTQQPVTARKNQYRGVNAHLNSQLQESGWETFHSLYIGDIFIFLNNKLRGSGYVARLEDSLQIRRGEQTRQPEADVLILDRDPLRSARGPAAATLLAPDQRGAAVLVDDPAHYDDIAYFRAVSIYRSPEFQRDKLPEARIELLAPDSKSGGRCEISYQQNRAELLGSASCVFVEIDTLHETPSTIRGDPDYQRDEPGATAYRVLIADTRDRGIRRGLLYVLRFGVDEPMPVVTVPLHGDDMTQIDLGPVYDQTFERGGFGINDETLVDYRQPPRHVERYTPADQARIAARARTVVAAAERGVDLEMLATPLEIGSE